MFEGLPKISQKICPGKDGDTPSVRDGFPKKSSCSFGFYPNEWGGRPCSILSTSQKPYILGQFGDGEEGETPAQIFWHIGVQKSGTSCPN